MPETREKTAVSDLVPPDVPLQMFGSAFEAAELIEIWNDLDEAARADLLAVARGLRREH